MVLRLNPVNENRTAMLDYFSSYSRSRNEAASRCFLHRLRIRNKLCRQICHEQFAHDLENFDIISSPYNTQPDEILQRVHLLAVTHLNVSPHSSGTDDVLEDW